MKKIKVAIVVLILITICISMILIKRIIEEKEQEEYNINHDKILEQVSEVEDKEDDKLVNLSFKSDYFTIKNNIDEYIKCVNFININSSDENINRIYEKLDDEYIKLYNITKNNVQDFYSNYGTNNEFFIDKVLVKDINQMVNIYIIYGRLIDKTNYTSKDYGFIMQSDIANNSYSLILYDYMKEKKLINLNEGDTIAFQAKDSIEAKQYNTFSNELHTDEELVKEYFNKLANDIKYDRNHLYEMLNQDYKQKKFESIDKFSNYINKLSEKELDLSEYTIDEENGLYICKDTSERYYVFSINSILEYTVMLDTYTVNLPEFIDKYNSTTDQGRVILNIDKFFKSVNDDSYYYAYNCLSDGFKNNYFKTLEDFEKYMNNNLFNNNKIEYEDFEEEAGLYKYTIEIINLDDENQKIEKTIIMKLNEGTDFEMSFNV